MHFVDEDASEVKEEESLLIFAFTLKIVLSWFRDRKKGLAEVCKNLYDTKYAPYIRIVRSLSRAQSYKTFRHLAQSS